MNRASPVRALTAALLFLAVSCARHKDTSLSFPLLTPLLDIEQSCMLISRHLMAAFGNADTLSFCSFYHVMDSTGDSLAAALGDTAKNPWAVDSILATVYRTWGIGFDNRDTVLETLLPHHVFKNKKGACLGVSLIILMLAEKAESPVYGVMLPGHFFCRFDDGSVRRNIEPNKAGFNHPDDYYRQQYPVAQRSWYTLANLSKQQTIGMLCYNAGVICMKNKKEGIAIPYFKEAMRRLNGLPEAIGNCALAYAQKGDTDSSLALFAGLFAAHPGLANCAANYGTVLLSSRQWKTAREVFEKGLEYYPEDTVLKRGLEESKRAP
jgi:regulator of sirC expression with transglutaminase-like and TPR domain